MYKRTADCVNRLVTGQQLMYVTAHAALHTAQLLLYYAAIGLATLGHRTC